MNTVKTDLKWLSWFACLSVGLLMIGNGLADGPAKGQLTEQEKRGKYIYLSGASKSAKEITCFLGDAATEVPASTMLCANCHGLDGRGNPEGGVVPSDITWQALTKSYGVTHPSGRKHPPYSDRAIEIALTKGLDPAGNRLSDAMPRYWMSREDLADLIAYIKRLGGEQDPGLTESRITVGAILPLQGRMADIGQATKAVLEAYFEDINASGGVYNRRIELRVANASDEPKAARAAAEQFIDTEQVFAMAGAFIAGADEKIISLVEEKEVPLVGPYTLYPAVGFPLNRHTFYLLPGLQEQVRALVNFAGEKIQKQNPHVAVMYAEGDSPPGLKGAIEEQCRKRQYNAVINVTYSGRGFEPGPLIKRMSDAGTDAVFILRFGEQETALLKEAERLGWTPYILMPGAVVGRAIIGAPAAFRDKIFLSFPTAPADQTRQGLLEYRALAEKHKLPAHNLAAQFSAYAAAKILVEALKLSGRELSREKLIKTLEGFYQFETGLTPPVTFGPNRRIGALGAYIVTVDLEKKEFRQVGGWVSTE